MGTRIMFIMVFGIVLLLGSVVALTSLTSHSYIEKTKDGYIVWEGVEYYKVDLEEEKVKLENKIIDFNSVFLTYEECYNKCFSRINECIKNKEKYFLDYYNSCEELYTEICTMECDWEFFDKPRMIEYYQEEIKKIDKILKTK